MEFKQKWKRFWTLTRHRDGGFTLVELVVVIAILAILAGVAVPAYNGYIEKEKTAADQQLLAAVNKAFAAACMEAKVDSENVTEAHISMMDQKVYGLSKVKSTVTETSGDAEANFATIASAFTRYYTESNENAVFKTEGINSLQWENGAFVMKTDYVDTVITISNGKSVVVSAEDMAMLQASTFADMGYSGIASSIKTVSASGELLAKVAGSLFMMDKLTNVMLANGFVTNEQAEQLESDLAIWNFGQEKYSVAAGQAGNGLQMVTAKYLAGASSDAVDELLGYTYTDSTSMLKGMTENGGTKTVSGAAIQYAMVQSFANSSASEGTTISYTVQEGSWPNKKDVTYTESVSEFLASDYAADDPIKAMAMVQATDGYKAYKTTEQYTNDVNGFVGAMSLLGDNLGTVDRTTGAVETDGAIAPGDYLTGGIDSDAAKEVLTEVLGE